MPCLSRWGRRANRRRCFARTVDDDVAARSVGAVVLHDAGNVLGKGQGTPPARGDDRQLRKGNVVDDSAEVPRRLSLHQIKSALYLDRLAGAADLEFGVDA